MRQNELPKRVLHLIYGLNVGGIETLVMNIYRKIDKTKIQFDFLVLCGSEEKQFFDEEIEEFGGVIYKIGSTNPNVSRRFVENRSKIKSFFREHKYKIVHIHSGQIDKLPDVRAAAKSKASTVIVHSHNDGLHRNAKLYNLRIKAQGVVKQLYSLYATDFFTCSMAAANWSFPKTKLKNVKMIRNGVLPSDFTFSETVRDEYRKKLEIFDETLLVGHVGRFNFQKNHEFLIRIFAEIVKLKPKSKLLLIGEGDRRTLIEDFVREKKLENNVIFLGRSNEVNKWLQAMDCFVLPSHYEGLPVVGIECQAAALPLFMSDKITKETQITDFANYISLDESPDYWARIIIEKYNAIKRIDTSSIVKEAGYSILDTALELQNFYLERF